MLSINCSTPFIQRVAVIASIHLTLSSLALLILLNYPAIGDASILFTATAIGGASFLTLLVSCGILQCQKKRQFLPIIDSSPINLLPIEILTHILSFLSPKEHISCSLVCKTWHEIVKGDRDFWRQIYIREQLPFTVQLNWKKVCVLFPIFLRKFNQYQSNRLQVLRYKEWHFIIKDHLINKIGPSAKSLEYNCAFSPFRRIAIVGDSIFGIRQNYTIDEWNCISGKFLKTIKTSLTKEFQEKKSFKKKLADPYSIFGHIVNRTQWADNSFLIKDDWLIFKHPEYKYKNQSFTHKKKQLSMSLSSIKKKYLTIFVTNSKLKFTMTMQLLFMMTSSISKEVIRLVASTLRLNAHYFL